MTRIVAMSDSHNKHNKIDIPECDILIHCGDFSSQGHRHEVEHFNKWLNRKLKEGSAREVVLIAGNHDLSFDIKKVPYPEMKDHVELILTSDGTNNKNAHIHYLFNNHIVINNIKIWGSPYQPEFNNWAFNYPRNGTVLKETWDKIPEDIDILITHCPPYEILDKNMEGEHCGCELLRKRIEVVKPKYHLFGHIHEGSGINYWSIPDVVCVNASICDFNYRPLNKPVEIEI